MVKILSRKIAQVLIQYKSSIHIANYYGLQIFYNKHSKITTYTTRVEETN